MAEGRFNLGWPWHWLLETRTAPLVYEVPPTVQPVLDVARQWPQRYEYQETTQVVAANDTTMVAAEQARVGLATAVPLMTLEIDDVSTITSIFLFYNMSSASVGSGQVALKTITGTIPPAGAQIPLIGGRAHFTGIDFRGVPPVYLVRPSFLSVSILNGAQAANATVRFLIQQRGQAEPIRLPFPF